MKDNKVIIIDEENDGKELTDEELQEQLRSEHLAKARKRTKNAPNYLKVLVRVLLVTAVFMMLMSGFWKSGAVLAASLASILILVVINYFIA